MIRRPDASPRPDQAQGPTPSPPLATSRAVRDRDGWEHRFITSGARAEEMIALYRELGWEVAADPVAPDDLVDGCNVCFGDDAEAYLSIYTRKPPTPDG